MLSSAELCLAGPREPGGAAVGHQRAPPAQEGSCRETQEAPRPQAKLTRGRWLCVRPRAVLELRAIWPQPLTTQLARLAPSVLRDPAPPLGPPQSLIPLLWPPE